MMRQFELVERAMAADPAADEEALNRAYVFSMKAHGAQRRASGDPYFSHPVEVAGLLAGMRLDGASVITGLLHDTVEDTAATLEEVERLFGPEIAKLVDGVTKLSRLELQSDQTKQAENFQKLVLAMSEDIRVLLVKLADRLHNMRTLRHIKDEERRRRIARETMEIYAPLAERIGMHGVKDELEDLAFAELNPEARESIQTRLAFLRSQGRDVTRRITEELRAALHEAGLDAQIQGREKAPYSVWRKMQRKNVAFEQILDVTAFRVVVGDVERCYSALGAVHSRYPVVPGRFKDYISTPKPNHYRSLHTVVIGPERQRIEIQIRTREMHEEAELGVAAHWSYKQNAGGTEGPRYRWLRELVDLLEHASDPQEFLEHTKLEMYRDEVFCFTPKGDLIALPRGATPVDFAYEVHSKVGDACVGAKVNGRLAPLRSELANGDQVEIITAKSQTPSPAWERFVVTGKAKARIRRYVRAQQRQQYQELGKAILQKALRQNGLEPSERTLEPVLKALSLETVEDLHAAVGEGIRTGQEIVNVLVPPAPAPRKTPKKTRLRTKARQTARAEGEPIPIRGLIPGMAIHFAGCCHPLPGDRIVGIVATGKGVTIHTLDCDALAAFADAPERWLDLSWAGRGEEAKHVARLKAVLGNEPGSLGSLSTVIGRAGGNISNLKITNRSPDFFEMLIDVEVRDVRHLEDVIGQLRANAVVSSVERTRG